MTIPRISRINVKLSNNGSGLQSQTPLTLKNQVTEVRSLDQLNDVVEVSSITGATLVYNSVNDKYEVKKLEFAEIGGTINLDGGEF